MVDYGGATISLSQAAHTSEDDDDSSEHSPRSVPLLATPKGGSASASPKTPPTNNNNEISAIDYHHQVNQSTAENSTKKPRGRPPGSKNKPKPPIVITRDIESVMKPVVLEISAGADIIENIISFARRNQAGLSVISASGSVSTVTLRHPTAHMPLMSVHGPFNLISLSGTFLGGSSTPCFGVSLAGLQGHVFGGIVAGKVTAGGQVVVLAATFVNPEIHRLPICEEGGDNHHHQDHNKQEDGGGGASDNQTCSNVYGGGGVVASPTPLNCQMSPDVMLWGPRPPY
ncbi:hypothetical protein LWI29_031189 [Acer saccharum]|uniref:PPC domain-containing protein n=1 Tax=Acer saccharum TaxID=4024 RepID=A0AA39TLF6_ACESA|nr:hypothetical protein LWI29_031189 [Acer saccharum]KAK1588998.1 hypothetical protein Q3G72_029392 [Acer saccharum]